MTVNRPADGREYVRISVDLSTNPKLADLDPRSKWLHVCAITYAGRHLTDGRVHVRTVLFEADVAAKYLEPLVARGVLHRAGHDCQDCQDVDAGWVVVHDYLKHQRSREQAAARRAAGKAGATARWNAKRNAEGNANRIDADDKSAAEREQNESENAAETTAEPHTEQPVHEGVDNAPTRTTTTRDHANRNANRNATPNAEVEGEGEGEEKIVAESVSQARKRSARDESDRPTSKPYGVLDVARALGSDTEWACKVADTILGRAKSTPRDATAYVLAAIRDKPADYQPTPTAPRLADLCDHGRDARSCPFCRQELTA